MNHLGRATPLSVDVLADELLAAIRDHPEISLDPVRGPETARLCAAYNRLYCELHDKESQDVVSAQGAKP